MNYLAHLALAAPGAEFRIGSVLGDFTNVGRESLAARYGADIAAGVSHHRQIDAATDRHEAVTACVKLLFASQRHYARIALDICYDYFLVKHWDRFCDVARPWFIRRCYADLQTADERLPQRFVAFAARAAQVDLLNVYQTLDGVEAVLRRVAGRIRHRTNLAAARQDIEMHYDAIERSFLRLYPDLQHIPRYCDALKGHVF
jgi:acyl carrier protein phosphodiesterase